MRHNKSNSFQNKLEWACMWEGGAYNQMSFSFSLHWPVTGRKVVGGGGGGGLDYEMPLCTQPYFTVTC